tara:strand:- start:218 stop:367 length:150 start_codon:yes stop_codon:yes gene_type:complete
VFEKTKNMKNVQYAALLRNSVRDAHSKKNTPDKENAALSGRRTKLLRDK